MDCVCLVVFMFGLVSGLGDVLYLDIVVVICLGRLFLQ